MVMNRRNNDEELVAVILDTDIDTDCDDAGALAVLHALADNGEAEIAAMMCNTPIPWGAPCLRALNAFYGKPFIPVGELKITNSDSDRELERRYAEIRKEAFWRRYSHLVAEGPLQPVPDAVKLYRETLAARPDGGVVVCSIGLLTNLANLLRSDPDEVSPLTGRQLIARKIRKLVVMGGTVFPEGEDAFNWKADALSAGEVLNGWPGPLSVTSYGDSIRTGKLLFEQGGPDHLVRRIYEIYLGKGRKTRPSWDQVAVLNAVRERMFTAVTGCRIRYDAGTNRYVWHPDEASGHAFVRPLPTDGEMERLIDRLMIGLAD